MQSIRGARRAQGATGKALPPGRFTKLFDAGVKFHYGELHMIAAASGVGKTAFLLDYLVDIDLFTMYFSPDNNAATLGNRMAAKLTGEVLADIKAAYDADEGERYDETLDTVKNLRFDFKTPIDPLTIEKDLQAFAIAYGAYPAVVVLDTLNKGDTSDNENEFAAQAQTINYLQEIARITGAAVFILHHVKGEHGIGTGAPPLTAVKGQLYDTVEMVVTLFARHLKDHVYSFGFAPVKNRNGLHDQTGATSIMYTLDYSTMTFT